MRRAFLAAVLLLLSGCVAEDAEPQGLAEVPDAAPAGSGEATALNVTLEANASKPAGSWFASVTPEAPVAGFRLAIPEGTAHPHFEGSIIRDVPVAVAPVFDEAPEAMVIAFFDLADGHLLASHALVPVQGTAWLTAALPTDVSGPAAYDPFVLRLPEDVDGQDVGVVVAARGLAGPAALLLSPDAVFEFAMDPPHREALEARGVAGLLPIGTGPAGPGFALDLYQEVAVTLATGGPGVVGYVVVAGEPVLERRLPTYVPPHGGARDDTIRTGGREAGWSYSVAEFICGEGAAQYAVAAEAATQSASDEGTFVWAGGYGLLAGALVTGLPVASAQGDGPGPAGAELTVLAVETDQVCIVLVQTLAFPVPLATLLSLPAQASAFAWTGLVSQAPVVGVAGVPSWTGTASAQPS